jgi:Mrp family chromosome partitioning ATPase
MIRLALLTSNVAAADAIEQMVQDAGIFELVYRGLVVPPTDSEVRQLCSADPDIILLEISDWQRVSQVAAQLSRASRRGALVGFCRGWSSEEQKGFEEAGIVELLHESFSPMDLEKAAHRAVHRRQPLTHQNILAFLPSKAGSGCTTVALNTAAALANDLDQRTLLVEADRRSGTLSILLDVEGRGGLAEVLARSSTLTGVEWSQHIPSIGKLDLLLANPFKPGPLPSWVNYYQMLLFAQKQYDFIVVDLPEVVNPATTELLSAAQRTFIVCEPEVTSLKLVSLRRADLEACGVPTERIYVLGNRWDPRRLEREDVVRAASAPMFAALPNDYEHVKNAALESRLVFRNSPFGSACAALARRLANAPETEPSGPLARLLRRFTNT